MRDVQLTFFWSEQNIYMMDLHAKENDTIMLEVFHEIFPTNTSTSPQNV